MDCIIRHIGTTMQTLTVVPATSCKNVYVDPWAFDFSEHSKFGECGRFPSNHQFLAHYGSFLQRGLETHREAFDIKFPAKKDDPQAMFKVLPFSVGFVDGQGKALIVQALLALLSVLVTGLVIYID